MLPEITELRRLLQRAEDGAGTLPAKDSVKLKPKDWHALADAIRALQASLVEAPKVKGDDDWRPTGPCPFCRSEITTVGRLIEPALPAAPYAACCGSCGASGPERPTIDEATADWKRLSALEPSQQEEREPVATEAQRALQAIERIIRTNIVDNGQPNNRMLIDGEWHSGPVVDAAFRILKGLGQIASEALSASPPESAIKHVKETPKSEHVDGDVYSPASPPEPEQNGNGGGK